MFGYIESTFEERENMYSSRSLLGAPTALPGSQMRWVDLILNGFAPIRDQKHTQSCVGHGIERCIQLRLYETFGKVWSFSASGIYKLGLQMGKSSKDDLLPDTGIRPMAAVAGIESYGLLYEADLPFDEETILEEIPFDLLMKATQHKIKGVHQVSSDGSGRIREVRHALSKGYPVAVGQRIDRAYVDFQGDGVLGPKDVDSPSLGGHMTAIVGYEGDVFYECNSWGSSYGDRGLVRRSSDWLASTDVIDLLVFTMGGS